MKKFCTISFRYQSLSIPDIDYGQSRKYNPLKNSTFVHKLKQVEYMTNFVQVMNYLTGLGWNYEGNISTAESDRVEVKILFSREFHPAELTEGE